MLSSIEIEELANKTAEATTEMVKEHPVVSPNFGNVREINPVRISNTENKLTGLLPSNE